MLAQFILAPAFTAFDPEQSIGATFVNQCSLAAVSENAGHPVNQLETAKMIKTLIFAISATLISGAALAAAHTGAPKTDSAMEEKAAVKPTASETKKDAAGKTQANRENKMSPTGQNETSSVSTNKKEAESSGGSSMKSK